MSWLLEPTELIISIIEASEEEVIVVNQFKGMYDLGEKARGVIFQKVDFKR